MNPEKDIFLPDTTLKYKVLREKLKENYNLEVMPKKTKYAYLGIIATLTTILLIKIIKK